MENISARMRDRRSPVDAAWLHENFGAVRTAFLDGDDAETLALWATKTRGLEPTGETAPIDELLEAIVRRWVSGDPAYKMALKRALTALLVWRARLFYAKEEAKESTKEGTKSSDGSASESTLNPTDDPALLKLVTLATSFAPIDPRITYPVLETIARTSGYHRAFVLASLPEEFIASAFAHPTGAVGRCLAVLLASEGPETWFRYAEPHLRRSHAAVIAGFIEPTLKLGRVQQASYGDFVALCRGLGAEVELALLKAGRNAKIDVSAEIQASPAVAAALGSENSRVRGDAISLLCTATHKLSAPVPPEVFSLIMRHPLLSTGDPGSRADLYGALRALLLRMRTSHTDAPHFLDYMVRWCVLSLARGMPYRCLASSSRLLVLISEYMSLLDPARPWHRELVVALVNSVAADFADVRETAVALLSTRRAALDDVLPELRDRALELVDSSRGSEAGARLVQFVAVRKPEWRLVEGIVEELEKRVAAAERNVAAASRGKTLHGLVGALRLCGVRAEGLVRRVLAVCTPPLTGAAPEGTSEVVRAFCWRGVKEGMLYLEWLYTRGTKATSIEGSSEDSTKGHSEGSTGEAKPSLASELASMLTHITHWGAFSAIPPAFVAVCPPAEAKQILNEHLHAIAGGVQARSITRRSGGLPLLITACLEVEWVPEAVDELFALAVLPLADGDGRELPQVHGMNGLRAIVSAAPLAPKSAGLLARVLELCLAQFVSPSWSLRNCASMLFSALYRRLFGVNAKPVAASVFFSRHRGVQAALLADLAAKSRGSALPAVFPSLAVLAKLRPAGDDDALAAFWEPLVELLGAKAWQIRALAALAVAAITKDKERADVVAALVANMRLSDQNELHGYGLAVMALIEAAAESTSDESTNEGASDEGTDNRESRTLGPLDESVAVLAKLIPANQCWETNTLLYRCYAGLGGAARLLDPPALPHLNRSLATFEAAQLAATRATVPLSLQRCSPVLETVAPEAWTPELAGVVLPDASQPPAVRVAGLRALAALDMPPSRIALLSQHLLHPVNPASVRDAALALAGRVVAPAWEGVWIAAVEEFATAEAPERRMSALQSVENALQAGKLTSKAPHTTGRGDGIKIQEAAKKAAMAGAFDTVETPTDMPEDAAARSVTDITNRALYVLLDLLSDEDDHVRRHAAHVAGTLLGQPGRDAAVCAQILVGRISPALLAARVTAGLAAKAEAAKAALRSDAHTLFLAEKDSAYRDDLRSNALKAAHCSPDAENVRQAQRALKALADIDFEAPLGGSASAELLDVRNVARMVIAAANAQISF